MPRKIFEPGKSHMILRSHGKRREKSITILPPEIIFNILICIPAHVLYNVVRHVCREWRKIIDDPRFVSSHFMLQTSSLLLDGGITSLYHHMDVTDCDVKLTHFRFHLSWDTPILSTCNGLILIMINRLRVYCIGNPITRRMMALPPISSSTDAYMASLAFEPSSKVYKVVAVYDDHMDSSRSFELLRCWILTVGVDKAWRVVNCTHLNENDKGILLSSPSTGTGFVCWAVFEHRYILVFDLESESFKRISLPHPRRKGNCLIPKGQSITIFKSNSDFSIEVWVLKDHRIDEWVKFLSIEGETIRNELEKLLSCDLRPDSYQSTYPISWLGKDERIIFRTDSDFTYYFVYDLKTCACHEVALKTDYTRFLIRFVNTLGWVRGI